MYFNALEFQLRPPFNYEGSDRMLLQKQYAAENGRLRNSTSNSPNEVVLEDAGNIALYVDVRADANGQLRRTTRLSKGGSEYIHIFSEGRSARVFPRLVELAAVHSLCADNCALLHAAFLWWTSIKDECGSSDWQSIPARQWQQCVRRAALRSLLQLYSCSVPTEPRGGTAELVALGLRADSSVCAMPSAREVQNIYSFLEMSQY